MKTAKQICVIMIMFSVLFSCGKDDRKHDDLKPVIAVSILPQKYFLERIGGSRVSVTVLAGAGQNPHSYDPSPGQMASLAKAGAWILSGVDFETGLKPRIVAIYPSLNIIDGTSGVKFRSLEEDHHMEKEHNDHVHNGNIDRHTWLGRTPAKIMAGHMLDVLIKLDPAGKSVYESNHREFVKAIDSAFNNLKNTLAPLKGKKVFVFHPAFGYFLDEFDIKQEAVETGGKEPSSKNLAHLITEAKSEKPLAIFVQAQFPVNAAKTVADSVGAQVVMLDPLSPDWLDNITRMGEALNSALIKRK